MIIRNGEIVRVFEGREIGHERDVDFSGVTVVTGDFGFNILNTSERGLTRVLTSGLIRQRPNNGVMYGRLVERLV